MVSRKKQLDHRMVFFPLFATGFVLDDYLLKDNEYFGADTLILSSSSQARPRCLALLFAERRPSLHKLWGSRPRQTEGLWKAWELCTRW